MPAQQSSKGFSLVEIMVVIVIIAVLATVGAVIFTPAQKAARISKRGQDLNGLKRALELYREANDYYPSGAAANTFACISGQIEELAPAHVAVLPADPLDGANAGGPNCYEYASNATTNSTAYKLRTNLTISGSGEMTSSQFQHQPNLIDPDRDGTPNDSCAIQTEGTITGWAVFSGSTAICNLDST